MDTPGESVTEPQKSPNNTALGEARGIRTLEQWTYFQARQWRDATKERGLFLSALDADELNGLRLLDERAKKFFASPSGSLAVAQT